MNLRESMASDINIFIDTDEFAEVVNISGKQYKAVIDNERLSYRMSRDLAGLISGNALFYISESEGFKPAVNFVITFNGKPATITDVQLDHGMYEVVLDMNMG